MIEDGEGGDAERDALRREVEALSAEREALREEVRRLEIDRDSWRTDAQHWRSESARLVAAEQTRVGWRLREARFRYQRQVWRALPAPIQGKVRPLILRITQPKFVGPEPLQKDEAP